MLTLTIFYLDSNSDIIHLQKSANTHSAYVILRHAHNIKGYAEYQNQREFLSIRVIIRSRAYDQALDRPSINLGD